MIEKLKKFDVKISEIEKLKNFESRDGFILLNDEEFEEMQKALSQIPVLKDLAPLLTDENGNYWCIYLEGPMKEMVCHLSHDEYNLEPKFKNISNLLKAIDDNPEADDFDELDEHLFDFPSSNNPIEFEERKEIIDQLKSDFSSEDDEDVRIQIAYSIISLTSADEIEDNIYPFLYDEDMYIQAKAIRILGFHKYKPARDKLIELKSTAMHNGQTEIGIALKNMRDK